MLHVMYIGQADFVWNNYILHSDSITLQEVHNQQFMQLVQALYKGNNGVLCKLTGVDLYRAHRDKGRRIGIESIAY